MMESLFIQDHCFHLRPRDRNKEIGPEFRLMARDRFERINDDLKFKGCSFVTEEVGSPMSRALRLKQRKRRSERRARPPPPNCRN